ncbi:NUDIX hydrolase [soil metagenome]
MTSEFQVIDTRLLAEGAFLRFEELTVRSRSGSTVRRDVIRHPGGVAVLPVEGDNVWLIRQYRVALGRLVDEIPAGKLDTSDTDPETAARRELEEELGAVAGSWAHLATFSPSPGYTDEVIEIYAAENLQFGERRPDGAEEHEAVLLAMPIDEALDSIDNGTITDAKTQVALLAWNRRRR